VDFFTYNVDYNDKILKLVLMDTAGGEKFKSITRGYYKNCSFSLIVYDITDKKSFTSIKEWIEECQNYANDNIHMVLLGNKIDLNEERKISKEEGEELAKEYVMDFYETSAKTGENIEDIFLGLCELISNNIDEGKYDFNNPSSGVSEIPIGDEFLKVNKTFSLSEKNNYGIKYGIQIKKKNKCCK
jgi:small GTP-binding protein